MAVSLEFAYVLLAAFEGTSRGTILRQTWHILIAGSAVKARMSRVPGQVKMNVFCLRSTDANEEQFTVIFEGNRRGASRQNIRKSSR
ncbi:hypothetical protein BJ138DRAFT_47593 [Hygrophoropsis aurantiaca]|uniref:Uncharacterized protein n=1 Tax=Hygrophoropsis aurantiaca TaxID=72124 RepID=A0ACB8ACS7_9AGAM|nr:hypothetical protein BJ138DRAFT_47593 [Hygrophoropsis aurantiaca]